MVKQLAPREDVPEGNALVLFHATWCPYCTRFRPHMDDFEPREDVTLAEVIMDDDDHPGWDAHDVQVVPTLVAFEDGKEVAREVGRIGVGLPPETLGKLQNELPQA